jgi:8-oxo-dGTP diphosphatase
MFSVDRTRVAMVLKNRPAWQAGRFNAIGGKIEDKEDPAQAMAREFLEETGVDTKPSDWEFLTQLEGPGFEVNFFHMYSDLVDLARTVESEEIHLLDPLDLPPNIIHNIRWLIPLALDTDTITPRIIKHKG